MLKTLHLTTIAISLALFILRGVWMMADSPRLQARWVRIVPHLNDTLLLASGIGLAVTAPAISAGPRLADRQDSSR